MYEESHMDNRYVNISTTLQQMKFFSLKTFLNKKVYPTVLMYRNSLNIFIMVQPSLYCNALSVPVMCVFITAKERNSAFVLNFPGVEDLCWDK